MQKKKKRKRKPGEIIPLCYDRLFKKVFADPNHIERLEALVSIGLGVPLEDIKGRVSLLNSERVTYEEKEKKQVLDVIAEIKYLNKKVYRINIEVNLDKASTLLKGIAYGSALFGSSLKVSEDYSDIPGMIQISFDDYEINENNPRIVKEYYLKDETNTVLLDSLKFKHINIDKSQKSWYDNTIQKERLEDQNLIRFGATMKMNKKDDFHKSIEGVIMNEKIKKDIEQAVYEYSEDELAWFYFDAEKDRIASENARLSYAKEEGIELGKELGIDLGIDLGIEQGIEQNKIEVAKNMLLSNEDKDKIIKYTGLYQETIEKIKKEMK